jgi:hypothetical protein
MDDCVFPAVFIVNTYIYISTGHNKQSDWYSLKSLYHLPEEHNIRIGIKHIKNWTPCPESASELYRWSGSRFPAKLMPTFADRGCYVVSVTDPYGRILDFLDQSRCFSFQAAPQLYSRGWEDPVPDPLLLRKSDSAGNRTRSSGSGSST